MEEERLGEDMDRPLTRAEQAGPGGYAGKWCSCNGCRTVNLCQPWSDFYSHTPGVGPLFCGGCTYVGKCRDSKGK